MTQTQRDGIGRREFIMLASGTAVAAIAFGDQLLPASADAAPTTFSLGYSDLRSADGGGKVRVSSAAMVTSSDGSLISSGARVSVLGANVMKGSLRDTIYLDVKYHTWVDGKRQLMPFHAWSFDRSGKSSPVTFFVALDMDQRLSMTLVAKNSATPVAPVAPPLTRRSLLGGAVASAPVSDETPVVLSMTSESGTAKLRRGYYFIAPLMAGEREPSWGSYELRPDAGYKLYAGDTPAEFDYIVLRVDAAPLEDPLKRDRSDARRP